MALYGYTVNTAVDNAEIVAVYSGHHLQELIDCMIIWIGAENYSCF
jgi:hypothetical protein